MFNLKLTFDKASQKLAGNTAWLLGTEVAARASRLITIIALAKYLGISQYGTAMLALAFHDVIRTILRCGAGAQLVQCAGERLPIMAKNAATLQWMLCSLVAGVQYASAEPIAALYGNPDIVELIQWMALVYFVYPLTSIHVFLVQRASNFRFLSIGNGVCILIENLSVAMFAFAGHGLFSVVYAKFVGVLVWTLYFWFAPVRSYGIGFNLPVFRELINTSGKLFSTEMFKSLRVHADLFIAGKLLTPEFFGIYSFAKSAGIGLSQSLINAYNGALYPHVCRLFREEKLQHSMRGLVLMTLAISIVFVAQGLLAPVYVPMIFGEAWQASIPTVTLLCFAAVCNLFFDTYCTVCRAQSLYQYEFNCRAIVSIAAVSCILLMQPDTAISVGWAVLLGSTLWPCFFIITRAVKRVTQTSLISQQLEHKS